MLISIGFQIRIDLGPHFYYAIEALFRVMKKAFHTLGDN